MPSSDCSSRSFCPPVALILLTDPFVRVRSLRVCDVIHPPRGTTRLHHNTDITPRHRASPVIKRVIVENGGTVAAVCWGGEGSACLLSRWVSHPIHTFLFCFSPCHPLPPIFPLKPSPPPGLPDFHSFPFPSREHPACVPAPQHGPTMARSQSLLTPEPTHIVRQSVMICHMCVSFLTHLSPDGIMGRSSMPCHAKPRPWPLFRPFVFCNLTLRFLGNCETLSYVLTSAPWSTMSRTGASWSVL